MKEIRVLNDTNIKSVLDLKTTIRIVENVFKMKAQEKARLFPVVSEDIVKGQSEMDIKSGVLSDSNVFGLKLISWFGTNKDYDLPTTTGLAMIFDLDHGCPRALLNAEYLTAMRTGASGAIGVKYLARRNSKSMLVIGTGNQAIFQIAATLAEVDSIERVYVFNPRDYDKAKNFRNTIKEKLSNILYDTSKPDNKEWIRRIEEVEFFPLANIEYCMKYIDVIVTTTPSQKALIFNKDIARGTHINCIGADVSGKQEIDENIFSRASVFTDDIEQAVLVGECEKAFKQCLLKKDSIREIGHLILKGTSGRTTGDDITVFDSTGIALQDIAVSKYLLDEAMKTNQGVKIAI